MTDLSSFKRLAANWDEPEDGQRYIRPKPQRRKRWEQTESREPFYEDHVRIALTCTPGPLKKWPSQPKSTFVQSSLEGHAMSGIVRALRSFCRRS
jgi:hypothetical protein